MNLSQNLLELCRLCLSTDNDLISVLEDGIAEELLEKIYTCLLVEISEHDEVSQKVCQCCLDKVNSFYLFRHQVADSQEQLGRLLVNSNQQSQENKLTYSQNVQEIEAELERELNEKSQECWQGSDILTNVIYPEQSSKSNNHDQIYKSDNTEQPSILDISTVNSTISDINIVPDNNSDNSVSKSKDLLNSYDIPHEPGGSSPHDSLFDGLAQDSLQFCTGEEEKSDNPLDLRCNIANEDLILIEPDVIHKKKCKIRQPCTKCNKTFSSIQSLLKHINKHHSKYNTHICSKCNAGFKTPEQLKVHTWSHKEKYSCDKCSYNSYSLGNFKLHVMKHNSEYLAVCEECGKGFYRISSYEEHKINKHSQDVIVYKCDECGKAYHSRGYLRQHIKTHAPGFSRNDYQCETCGKTFLSWKGIRRHMTSSHEGNRYKCDICSKEVTSLQSLKTHKKIHSGEKSYVCDTCGKTFIRLNSLIVHRRIHTGEKPYVCDICDKSFSQRSTLNVHKRCHTGERPYPCSICNKTFITKTLMTTHFKSHDSYSASPTK